MHLKTHWLETYENSESVDILRDLALSHTADGGAIGAEIAALIRRGDFRALCEFKIDYNDPRGTCVQFMHCRQALAFFSKLEDLDVGVDKEREAWLKFVWTEERCRETNHILKERRKGNFMFSPEIEGWLFMAASTIATVLGPVPSLERLGLRFGKGATTLTKKRQASVVQKLGAGVSCSETLFPMAKYLMGEMPQYAAAVSAMDRVDEDGVEWSSVPIRIDDGKLDFARKNALTYRATLTEPSLNGMFQMGIGDHMVRRFAAFGLDLRDQSRNQRLARVGSLTGALATLDQKSASDLQAYELIFELCPLDWATYLARATTRTVSYRGMRFPMEKFSSMGNGFTFPLESLIFWALAKAVVETTLGRKPTSDELSVFGDDVIVPSACVDGVIRLYNAVGFVINEEKSFKQGPFRESCGKDYFSGIDIRPFYQKDLVSARSLFVLHNFYVRNLDFARAEGVLNRIHPCLRIYGPDGYGDGHLLGPQDRTVKARHVRHGYAGYVFDTFTQRPRKDIRPNRPGDCVLPTYSVYRRSAEHLVPLLKDVRSLIERCEPSPRRGFEDYVKTVAFLSRFQSGMGTLVEALPFSEEKLEDESVVKAVPLPMTDDESYKRISIYTLG